MEHKLPAWIRPYMWKIKPGWLSSVLVTPDGLTIVVRKWSPTYFGWDASNESGKYVGGGIGRTEEDAQTSAIIYYGLQKSWFTFEQTADGYFLKLEL